MSVSLPRATRSGHNHSTGSGFTSAAHRAINSGPLAAWSDCSEGADPHAEGGVVLPDLHIGREPDGKRIVAGPLERFALGDEGIVVTL
jgi:hypothetical protein